MQPVSARVPASLSPAFVRPSFVPLLYMRRGRVSRRVMHISLNRPGNCAFNISELFSRRERAYSARFSERGRFCPPPFIAHLSSCARRLFAMRRSKVAKRVHSRTSLAPTLLSRRPHFFLRPSNTCAFRLACCDFLFTSLYPCNELQSIEKYAKKIIYSFCLISALLIVKLIDISYLSTIVKKIYFNFFLLRLSELLLRYCTLCISQGINYPNQQHYRRKFRFGLSEQSAENDFSKTTDYTRGTSIRYKEWPNASLPTKRHFRIASTLFSASLAVIPILRRQRLRRSQSQIDNKKCPINPEEHRG